MSCCFTCNGSIEVDIHIDNMRSFMCIYCSIQAQVVGLSNYEFACQVLTNEEHVGFLDRLLNRTELLKIGYETESSPLLLNPFENTRFS